MENMEKEVILSTAKRVSRSKFLEIKDTMQNEFPNDVKFIPVSKQSSAVIMICRHERKIINGCGKGQTSVVYTPFYYRHVKLPTLKLKEICKLFKTESQQTADTEEQIWSIITESRIFNTKMSGDEIAEMLGSGEDFVKIDRTVRGHTVFLPMTSILCIYNNKTE